MFGKKSQTIKTQLGTIKNLQEDVNYWRKTAAEYSRRFDDFKGVEAARDSFKQELANQKELNFDLSEENSGLAYKLEMYEALFRQFRINVKLPSKK